MAVPGPLRPKLLSRNVHDDCIDAGVHVTLANPVRIELSFAGSNDKLRPNSDVSSSHHIGAQACSGLPPRLQCVCEYIRTPRAELAVLA